jgi:ABC-2 type transport system permease protein
MSTLVGTGKLVRLILRRDRLLLPLWVLVLALLPVYQAAAIDRLYSTPAQPREPYGTVAGTPGLLAMLGPVFGATLGALTVWRAGIAYTIASLASLLTVIRHTRTDEEAGRRELLGATVVGRNAPLTAAAAAGPGPPGVPGQAARRPARQGRPRSGRRQDSPWLPTLVGCPAQGRFVA